MSKRPKALLVDDGELGLARAVLTQLGVDFWHVRGAQVHGPLPEAERLLVIPARLAVAKSISRSRPKPGEPPLWLAFVPAESKSQRKLLRQAGFDFTVPEGVHPAALRLLMARALFEGENTQRVTRVSFGAEVTFVTTLRRHRALLVDISPRGCRLLAKKPPKEGAKITVQVPSGEATPLQLQGVVVRTAPGTHEGGLAEETSVGVRFGGIDGTKREQLKALLIERLSGPKPFGGPPDPSLEDSGSVTPPQVQANPGEPAPAVYERRLDAFSAGTTRVLMGRDLAESGMRVEARGKLEVGERLRLALPVEKGEPLMIEAHVATVDGKNAQLMFDWMEPRCQDRLRELIAGLPKIHRLQEDTSTFTAVPAAILEASRRGRRR